jgi:hypothetical protein
MLPSTFGLPLLRGKSRSVLVVSRHLDSLLHTKLADLLHSALNHGVRYVSIPTQPVFHKRNRLRKKLSRNAFHTPRRISLTSSRIVSPRPLPSCRCRKLLKCQGTQNNSLSTSRFYSTDELAMLPRRFQHNNTRSFHGLCSPPRSSIRRFAQDESCSKIPSLSSQWRSASETPPTKTEALIFGPQ